MLENENTYLQKLSTGLPVWAINFFCHAVYSTTPTPVLRLDTCLQHNSYSDVSCLNYYKAMKNYSFFPWSNFPQFYELNITYGLTIKLYKIVILAQDII